MRITVVCLGNICRSPMGEAVLLDRVRAAGLATAVSVDSAGTGDWHLGHDADPRTRRVLTANNYSLQHRARQIQPDWLPSIDLLLAMDAANHAALQAMIAPVSPQPTLAMFRSFDPDVTGLALGDPRLDVPDPYYGTETDFASVLRQVEAASDGLVQELPGMLAQRANGRG